VPDPALQREIIDWAMSLAVLADVMARWSLFWMHDGSIQVLAVSQPDPASIRSSTIGGE
jgi:hypothetical protein